MLSAVETSGLHIVGGVLLDLLFYYYTFFVFTSYFMAKKETDILALLQLAGLDRRESAFYAAALSLGKGLVSQVAQTADLNRSASYEVMEALKARGLVSTAKSSRGLLVIASDPEHLLNDQKERYEKLSTHIADLKYLFTLAKHEPGVRMYEGKEGLKEVLQMLLASEDAVCIYGDGDAFKKAIPGWTEYYSTERANRAIRSRLLLKASPEVMASAQVLTTRQSAKAHFSTIRVLPSALGVVGGFDVVGDKLVLYSFEETVVAVVIESKLISQMMMGVFNMLWTLAEPYQKTLLK
jgi:sugar-specific transcriptional regulator TrmB